MSWTYGGDPSASLKDAVRFNIGDVDIREPLLLDGEIRYLLGLYNNNVIQTSIRACEAIIAKFGRLVDESVGQVRLSYSQRIEGYKAVRKTLEERLALNGDCIPFCGGISKQQVKEMDLDPDRIKPDFTKHMMENQDIAPWVTNEGYTNNQDPEG